MLELIFALGLVVFFTIELVRKLPKIEGLALEGKRPWSCDLCMSFWTSGLWSGIVFGNYPPENPITLLLVPGAAAGVALFMLHFTNSLMPGEPPELP